MTTQKL